MTRSSRYAVPVAGGLFGAAFFLWIVGLPTILPTQVEWVMKLDWRIHFLGWHLFRSEPWHWPPGRLDSYYHAPTGTAIGYTDSLPLVAFALKPFEQWLPMPLQYLGVWMLACFALQGVFGVLLVRLWSENRLVQVLGGMLFVLVPTLLNRVVHPALCAHWTILWALWAYFRWQPGDRVPAGTLLTIGVVVGLIHPYLAVMVLAVCVALTLKMLLSREARWMAPAGALCACVAAVTLGWWASGLFLVPAESMARPGLSTFSMNLLSPVTPSGWSALLPPMPISAAGQTFEGFQYLGAGVIALLTIAVARSVREWRCVFSRRLWPLVGVAAALAIYALSPRVTAADWVVVDLTTPAVERLAVFGVTGRFFWVFGYMALTLAVAVVARRFSAATSVAMLSLVLVLQVVDLQPAYAERRVLTRSELFHTWTGRLTSPAWAAALPHYDHIVLYHPLQCGGAPLTFEGPAYLAGFHGVTVNVGEVARSSEAERVAYCAALDAQMASGAVKDRELYLVHRPYEPRLRAHAPDLRCGEIDNVRVCATVASYEKWKHAARLE